MYGVGASVLHFSRVSMIMSVNTLDLMCAKMVILVSEVLLGIDGLPIHLTSIQGTLDAYFLTCNASPPKLTKQGLLCDITL